MAVAGATWMVNQFDKMASLIAELRDLNDYHSACDELVIEGRFDGRVIRFDPTLVPLSLYVKAEIEKRIKDRMAQVVAEGGKQRPVTPPAGNGAATHELQRT